MSEFSTPQELYSRYVNEIHDLKSSMPELTAEILDGAIKRVEELEALLSQLEALYPRELDA